MTRLCSILRSRLSSTMELIAMTQKDLALSTSPSKTLWASSTQKKNTKVANVPPPSSKLSEKYPSRPRKKGKGVFLSSLKT